MLLCMPPSVAEVKDLASMVKSWIDSTHGSTPRQRAQVRNALFLILTKFDLEFLEKGGETAESRQGKWDRRLHASLPSFTARMSGSATGTAVRSPTRCFCAIGMKQKHLMDYQEIVKHEDGSERLIEAGPAAASKGVIEEYHRAFAGSELVAKHFERAEETWAAAFTRRTMAASVSSSSG